MIRKLLFTHNANLPITCNIIYMQWGQLVIQLSFGYFYSLHKVCLAHNQQCPLKAHLRTPFRGRGLQLVEVLLEGGLTQHQELVQLSKEPQDVSFGSFFTRCFVHSFCGNNSNDNSVLWHRIFVAHTKYCRWLCSGLERLAVMDKETQMSYCLLST